MSVYVWPAKNKCLSSTLSLKYSILQKIALSNWFPFLHKTYVTKDLAILLFLIGTSESFDIGKWLFEIIVHNAKYKHASGILPFSSLIFEVLMLQKNILEENEILESPSTPLRISHKLFESKHAQDIQKNAVVPNDIP